MTTITSLPHAVPDDATLVGRARDGDVRAYEQLVSRYLTSVSETVATILPDRAEAEETVRDIFLLTWRHLPRLDDDAAFAEWLYRTTIDRCPDLLRSRRPRTGADPAPTESPAEDIRSERAPREGDPYLDPVERVMSAVRAEMRRGRILPLPTARPGRVRIGEQVVAAVVCDAADSVPGVRARRCRIAAADAGPGGGFSLDIRLTLAVRFGVTTAPLLPVVRERVGITVAERIGTAVHRLDIHLGDVYTEDDPEDRP
ncbi:RNA polymerase sigma factor [Nocardia paucivorans]|uniref:RNA polymerase sigma factor n=1 Tax=Nocardia paucivorans TaxID=114259 RepID=UPI0012F8732A|nr:sigma factor [Nocardia paucivorans]